MKAESDMPDSSLSFEYADAADRLFSDIATPQARVQGNVMSPDIWAALEEVMFPSAFMSEAAGGAGMSASEVGQIIESAGRHALSELLVDTVLARHWAARTSLDVPLDAPVMFVTRPLKVAADGSLRSAPAHIAEGVRTVVAICIGAAGPVLHRLDANRQGHFESGGQTSIALPLSPILLQAGAAAMASAWIAGALRGLLSLCVSYAGERQAFGRTISKFQAIQHHIAHLAAEVAAAEMAARAALAAMDEGDAIFEAAAAKTRADEAGRTGCRIAHQVFGAIGFTAEHPLHLYTGGIEYWRNRYGTGPEWAVEIGRAALAGGGGDLWPSLSEPGRFGAAMRETADA